MKTLFKKSVTKYPLLFVFGILPFAVQAQVEQAQDSIKTTQLN